MSRHRADPPPRYRPRYGRMVVLAVSVATTGVGLLGGLGVLTPPNGDSVASARASLDTAVDPVARSAADVTAPLSAPSDEPTAEPTNEPTAEVDVPVDEVTDEPVVDDEPAALPADSGSGRRAVFSQSDQQVWIVAADDEVERTYPVSGSVTDNLQPGTYEVYSRSENAYGIDDSGTMKWFVRFTQGPSGAAIGFHSIPVDDGAPVQTKAQLGTPQSHGCIRQKTSDALELWDFAPLGTTVVVV